MTASFLARDPAEILQSPDFIWVIGALVASLLIGAFILSRVDRWRKRQLSDSPGADMVQLSNYRALFEKGELSKEEYDRIKAKEAQRLRDKVVPRANGPVPAQKELPGNPAPAQRELPGNPSPPPPESPPPQ